MRAAHADAYRGRVRGLLYQTAKTCLATPPAVSGEKPPLWLRRKTCPEAGFTCVGTGFGTGNRRLQVDGTCPPGSEGPF